MIRILACLFLMIGAMPATAQLGSAPPHIRVALVAESAAPAPGTATTIAFRFTPTQGWHGYWRNPGDSGIETRVEWTLPAGVKAGALKYPVPGTLVISGLMNHVYEAPYALLATLEVPKGLAPGTRLPLTARIDWLECSAELCVPAKAVLTIELTVGDGAVAGADRAAFDSWRAALPRPLGSRAHYAVANGLFRLAVPLPEGVAVTAPHFFAGTDGALDYAAPQTVTRNGDRLILETKAGPNPPAGAIEGVLRIAEGQGLALDADPGVVPAAGVPLAAIPEKAGGGGTFLLALGGAVLGGLILNIMPCVFPILSLKALGLARAGGDERTARVEAGAYAAGVIALCLALGGLLLGLRAAGSAAGWAFQLQDPRVILFLLVLVTGIALNLAGLFEFASVGGGDALAGQGGAKGAFWTGALAAFVATPCTGPFMAGALGAALVLPWPAALAVFAGLGFGLALPFLLLGFVPALRRRLPRPGAWMDRLRRVLSVPMFLTALGLAWVLGQQAGVDGMTIGLAAMLVVGLALWAMGRRQHRGTARSWLPLVPAAGAAVLAIGFISDAPAVAAKAPGALGAEPFSEARLAAVRAERRPAFVYFTADWCLTCKVNEKAAIERAEVAAAFRKARAAVLVGDWTRGDPVIGRFIERQGRSGVPLYLWYGKDGRMRVLPQVLTPGLLTGLAG